MPTGLTMLLLAVIALAVLFDYINGFHDTANAIATSVSTRALRPEHAILMSATANFVGALTGTAVAKTISSGLATTPDGAAGQTIVAAALIGAIIWNLITWRFGIPSSSSHALIGGLLGAVAASIGASAMSLGTAAGGWRIIRTMGQKVVKLDPVHGFAAETTAASIIFTASHFGMPVSTTHVISSAIIGVGSSDRLSAVRWGVAGNIVIAWILTIPASALAAALAYVLISPFL